MASNFYEDEITDASFKELKRFIEWMNRRGTYPTVIGGWAVYAYEGGIGSRDIDVVMPDLSSINYILEDDYFVYNHYQTVKQGFVPVYYRKIVETTNGPADIHFDVFNGEQKREDSENLGIILDWSWTLQFQTQINIEDLQIYVPKRELLIILKIIAALGRTEDLKIKRDFRLDSKIWKDYRDVAVLTIGKKLDKEFLNEYLEKTNVKKYLDRFISRFRRPENSSILEELGASIEEIENSIK